MSTSSHVVDLLDDFIHDLLGPDEAARVESHCAACPRCGRALEQARRRMSLMQSVPRSEPSADLVEKTVNKVEEHKKSATKSRRRIVRSVVGLFAAAALILVAFHVYYANLSPGRHDVVLLGQNELLAGSKASLRVRVVDQETKKPAANLPVRVAMKAPDGTQKTLAEFKTDEQGGGNPRFDVPEWAEGQHQFVVTTTTGWWGDEVITQPVSLKRAWKVMLSSDKPVYQPGQKIKLRALALRRPDLKPVGEQDAIFTLTDPKGNVLFKHKQPTSKHGITFAECELASEIAEGAYVVACQVGDDRTGITRSQMNVEIRRYVLPKFEVKVEPDHTFYAPGDVATLTVKANYFFGKSVAKAAVEVKVLAEQAGERAIDTLKGETDDKGNAVLKYTIPRKLVGTQRDGGDARLTFAATVTDTAEQKQERRASRLVTTTPNRVAVYPESGALVRGVENVVYVLVTRADGAPVRGGRVEVSGDATADVFTDEHGAASFTITPAQQVVNWTIRVSSKDGQRLAAPRTERITCGQTTGDFIVRTDRVSYKAGQTMTLTALGAGVEPVFVDLIKDGQTLTTQTIDLKGGKGEYQFDVPPDVFGTIELMAYRFDGSGVAARKRRVLYVSPPEGLKINVALDKDEYRPGKTANLNLSLTDDAGKPIAGAISLAAVDAAVFSVLASRPGMESAFYNLEEELLKPVYAIYPWAPGEEQADRRDQALFSATAMGVAGDRLDFEEGPRRGRDRGWERAPKRGPVDVQRVQAEGRHTLAFNSFPLKQQQTDELRERRLTVIYLCWALLILTGLMVGYVGLWLCLPHEAVIKVHLFGGVALMVFMMGGVFFIGLFGMGVKSAMMPEAADLAKGEVRMMEREAGAAQMERMPAPAMPPMAGEAPKEDAPPDRALNGPEKAAPAAPRVRQYFPETLLWEPLLITDDGGKVAPLSVTLADSITTWQLSATAVSGDGRLGAVERTMKVFQPFFVEFNLPVSLTRGDEVGVPVVVYNYDNKPQTVKLTLKKEAWFTLSGEAEQSITLKPMEVRSTRFTLKVNTVGVHKVQVTAMGSTLSDAIEREIEVVPDGRKVEVAHSGTLDQERHHTLSVPNDAIEGSVKAFVKVYPSNFSQLVEGLDGIFRMPSGCFEQTSSTTYPNILALHYLKQTNQSSPKVEAKARQYVHLGYQRLVGFEVKGGGFEWFGNPPAHQTLTAYGLREFEAMAKVHDVDANLISRTRQWLLEKRKADGSWEPDQRELHDNMTGRDQKTAKLGTTAYVAWAVFADGKAKAEAPKTMNYLLGHAPKEIGNVHVLALVCNALSAMDPDGRSAAEYVSELLARRKTSDDGKFAWWEPPAGDRMTFYGGGESAKIETTALSALALLASNQGAQARPALSWLVTKKDANGTWHSTQATVLSLEALVAGTGKSLGGDSERRIVVRVGDHSEEIVIPADQAEVMKQLDVSKHLKAGDNDVSLSEKGKTAPGYQVVFRYHVPEQKVEKQEPLTIAIDYDRDDLLVGESMRATATVTNRMQTTAPMVMLDLPVPPGFAPDTGAFAAMVKDGTIARYQVRPRQVIVYLRALSPDRPLKLSYSLTATMPVKALAPAARVYEYYDPQKEGSSPARRFVVRAAKE